jgi:hypothetical protein
MKHSSEGKRIGSLGIQIVSSSLYSLPHSKQQLQYGHVLFPAATAQQKVMEEDDTYEKPILDDKYNVMKCGSCLLWKI